MIRWASSSPIVSCFALCVHDEGRLLGTHSPVVTKERAAEAPRTRWVELLAVPVRRAWNEDMAWCYCDSGLGPKTGQVAEFTGGG